MLEPRDCSNFTLPKILPIQSAVLSLLLGVIAVPSNLVILAIIWSMNRRQRTPFYLFVTNMVLADFVVGAVTDPLSFYYHLNEALGFNPSPVAIHLAYFIPCSASVFGLAAMTVDRGIAVKCPSLYRFRLSSRRVIITSTFIWLSSFGLSLSYFNVQYIIYSFVFAHVAVLITCVFLGFVYISVFNVLKKRARAFEEYSGGAPNSHQLKQNLRDKKITNVFLMILLVFVICYGPSCLAIYIMNFCTSCSCVVIEWLRDYALLLVLLNSSLNPVLFICRMQYFRHYVWKMIRCKKSEVDPSSMASTQPCRNEETEGAVGQNGTKCMPNETRNQLEDTTKLTCQNTDGPQTENKIRIVEDTPL